MKKLLLLPLLLCALLIPAHAAPEMRGTWISSVFNLDYPSAAGLSEEALRSEVRGMIDACVRRNLNAVFFQVRPCADALYRSDIFPWSAVLSGEQGKAPAGGFDPLAYFIEYAHANGVAVHAWINPYRVTAAKSDTLDKAIARLCESHPARKDPSLLLYSGGRLYFDPANENARALILRGISEILENYDVDGIHFDDYFYPEGEIDDAALVAASVFASAGDFRRAQVNALIEAAHTLCSEAGVPFGVSPAGIWANKPSMPEGSSTRGNQSYFAGYADSLGWVKNGWVDYIAPQLYWAIGSPEGEFQELCSWWRSAVKNTDVRLYIGIAAYRTLEAEADSPWFGGEEIIHQLDVMDMYGSNDGVIFFRYGSLADDTLSINLARRFSESGLAAGSPVFLAAARGFGIISPASGKRAVSGTQLSLCVAAPAYSRAVAVSDVGAQALVRRAGGLCGSAEIKDADRVLLLCEQNGVITLRFTEKLDVLSAEKSNILSKTVSDSAEGYTRVTFFTDTPAAAECMMRGKYMELRIAPCRLGFRFDCEQIRTMIFDSLHNAGKYTFAFYAAPTEYFVREYDDRIELYFR